MGYCEIEKDDEVLSLIILERERDKHMALDVDIEDL